MAVGMKSGFPTSPHRLHSEGRLARSLAAAFVVLWTAALVASPVGADERYSVRSGQAVFNFNMELLHDLGIELVVEADPIEPNSDFGVEAPCWTFPILKGTDLGFRSRYGVVLAGGLEGSALRLGGAITVRDRASGKQARFEDLEIARLAAKAQDPNGRNGTETLLLRSGATKDVFSELVHSMLDFRRKDQGLQIHYLNVRITEALARSIGRPELAGWIIGGGELRADVKLVSSTPSTVPRYQPHFTGANLDVGLGDLTLIQQVGHIGTFPTGTAGLSMETTICNFGTVDVPWQGPMQVNHPLIHMALYRLLNGRFEQVGISWMKHGFFALSNSQCTACLEQTDGSYLGLGCSDTYAVSNNSNRNYLGPRSEVNPYTAVWTCTGSHFSGGVPDCTRRHGSSGHDAVEHRLVVADVDLDNPGATYYYEACYFVRDDQSLTNNWGSRRCTMTSTGSAWSFSTPGTGNPLLAGPAIGRWGDLRTTVAAAGNDGEVTLAVQTTALGGSTYHYEYALLNRTSDRQIRSFSLPVNGVFNIANIGYHDNDSDPSNDWTVSVANGVITWQCPTFATDPNAHALVFGNLVNFRFDADATPVDRDGTLGLFKPGTGTDVLAATRGPAFGTAGVEEGIATTRPRLIDMRPNPFSHSTAISFELPIAASVKLEIYDAAGRLVRTLIDGGRDAGVHSATWDGNGDSGARARAGVYHARLRSGNTTSVRSLILVN